MRDNIKSEKNKKENKAALKKFVPMLIVWAFIGGIAGGISSFDDAEEFIRLGADRLGTSRLVKIMKNTDNGAGY